MRISKIQPLSLLLGKKYNTTMVIKIGVGSVRLEKTHTYMLAGVQIATKKLLMPFS